MPGAENEPIRARFHPVVVNVRLVTLVTLLDGTVLMVISLAVHDWAASVVLMVATVVVTIVMRGFAQRRLVRRSSMGDPSSNVSLAAVAPVVLAGLAFLAYSVTLTVLHNEWLSRQDDTFEKALHHFDAVNEVAIRRDSRGREAG